MEKADRRNDDSTNFRLESAPVEQGEARRLR